MADVRGLVGVDARVLDDHVPGPTGGLAALAEARDELGGERPPIEEEVDVAAARDLGAPDAGCLGQRLREALGDLAGLAAQALRQVERGGQGEVAQLHPRGVLEGDVREVDVEGGPGRLRHRAGEALLNIQDHSQLSYLARVAGPRPLTSFDSPGGRAPGPRSARVRYHGNMIRKALLLALLPAAVQAAPARHFDVTATFAPTKKAGGNAAVVVTFRPLDPDVRVNETPAPRLRARPHPGRARGQAGARLEPGPGLRPAHREVPRHRSARLVPGRDRAHGAEGAPTRSRRASSTSTARRGRPGAAAGSRTSDPGGQRPLSGRRRPARSAAPVAEEASSRSAGVLRLRKKRLGVAERPELERAQLEDAHLRPEGRHPQLACRDLPEDRSEAGRGIDGAQGLGAARREGHHGVPRARRVPPGVRGGPPGRAAGPPPRRGPGGPRTPRARRGSPRWGPRPRAGRRPPAAPRSV